MTGAADRLRIVAPVCSPEDVPRLSNAGADEFYCGAAFDDWVGVYGDSDLLTRRQGRSANLRYERELGEVVRAAHAADRPIALAVNGRYTEAQEEAVLGLVSRWADVGGDAVIVADVGILAALAERDGEVPRRYVSSLATVMNRDAVAFFAGLGVSRVILPRDLTLDEMAALTPDAGEIEFEVLAFYQKCQFVDGLCSFIHATRVPSGVRAEFDYEEAPGGGEAIAWSHDPSYEGHGCGLPWQTCAGPVAPLWRDDFRAPHCAACSVRRLAESGVRYLKVAGRGYPLDAIERAVGHLRESVEIAKQGGQDPSALRVLYERAFGRARDPSRCYYPGAEGRHGA